MAHGTTTAGAALMQAIGIPHAQATGRANRGNSAPPEASMQLHPDGGLEAADLQMARFVGGTQQHTTTRRPFNQKGFGSLHSGIWPSRVVS